MTETTCGQLRKTARALAVAIDERADAADEARHDDTAEALREASVQMADVLDALNDAVTAEWRHIAVVRTEQRAPVIDESRATPPATASRCVFGF